MLQLNKQRKFNPSEGMDEGLFIIEQEHAEFSKKHVLIFQKYGSMGLPKLIGDNANIYIDPIIKDYESIFPKIESKNEGGLQIQLGSIEVNEAKEANLEIQDRKDKAEADCKGILNSGNDKISYMVLLSFLLAIISFFFASIGEVVFQSIAMQGISGITPISGLFLGIGLFVVSTVISVVSRFWINRFETEWIKKFANIFVGIILFLLFFAIAQLRDSFQQTINNGGSSHFWVFILINFCLSFAVYLIIVFWIAPLREKLVDLFDQIARRRKFNRLQKEIKSCEAELSNIKRNLPNKLKGRLITRNKSTQYKTLIDKYCHQTIHQAIQANIERQKAVADCFLSKLPIIEFPKQSEEINNNQYEN